MKFDTSFGDRIGTEICNFMQPLVEWASDTGTSWRPKFLIIPRRVPFFEGAEKVDRIAWLETVWYLPWSNQYVGWNPNETTEGWDDL